MNPEKKQVNQQMKIKELFVQTSSQIELLRQCRVVKTVDIDQILVEDDIREEEDAARDIQDFSALDKSSKTQSALNHCNNFLKTYCRKEGLSCCQLQDAECDGIDKKGFFFWDKMIAGFLHHLASTAKCNFDPENEDLLCQTASTHRL